MDKPEIIKFRIGDIVRNHDGIVRKIMKVRTTGYEWLYPHTPDKTFRSEDSNDPFFEMENWTIIATHFHNRCAAEASTEVLADIDRIAAKLTPLRMSGLALGIITTVGIIVACIAIGCWLSRGDRLAGSGILGMLTGSLWCTIVLMLYASTTATMRMILIAIAWIRQRAGG